MGRVTEDLAGKRRAAARVANWLLTRDRKEEAIGLLCAWAGRGPNDALGQQLLAHALRLAPNTPATQQAFERMEGLKGDHAELELLLEQYDTARLRLLESELKGPTFRKAQIGFNNNVKAKGQVFHVQTEDSGLNTPHIITHLFADGGRVIKSHKRGYADALERESDIAAFVRQLMKAQHLEMVVMLRDGRFDEILAGERVGGVEVLEAPPDVNPEKLRRAAQPRAPAPAPAAVKSLPSAAAPPRAAQAVVLPGRRAQQPSTGTLQMLKPSLYTLHVVRSLGNAPSRYAVAKQESIIGTRGNIKLAGEQFCHERHALLRFVSGKLTVQPLPCDNGTFLRIYGPTFIGFGDELIVGDQLLRVEENPASDDHPAPDPTYFYGSPRGQSSFRIVQIMEGGGRGACRVARGCTLQIGSAAGDWILTHDRLVDPQHCLLEEQAGALLLTDLASQAGVFVRLRSERELVNGDEIVIGRSHLVVSIEATGGAAE